MKGIDIYTGFNLNSPVPIDSRFVANDLVERNTIPDSKRYEGLLVYVKEEKIFYVLSGGTNNSHWSEINSGSGSGTIQVTPQNFGAKADGATNDTNAIQEAIDYVSNQGGGTVYFPQGTYCIHPIYVQPNVIMQGAGIDSTIIKYADDGPDGQDRMFDMASNTAVKDLTMNGNWEHHMDGTEHMHCIFIYDQSEVLIERCKLHNARGDGISITGSSIKSSKVTVQNCHIFNNHRSQIVIEQVDNLKILNNHIEDGPCIHFEPFEEVPIYDCVISGNTIKSSGDSHYVVALRGYGRTAMYHNITFSNNYVDAPNSKLLLGWVDNCIITNNNFKSVHEIYSWYQTKNVSITNNMINASFNGINLSAGEMEDDVFEQPENYTISGNTIVCGEDGIAVHSGKNIKITGNRITTVNDGVNCSGVYFWAVYGINNFHISDNEISNFEYGVTCDSYWNSPIENIFISRNLFRGSPIEIETNITNLSIDSNTFLGESIETAAIRLTQIDEQRNVMITNNIFRDWERALHSTAYYDNPLTNVVVANNIIQGMTGEAYNAETGAPIEFHRYGTQPVDVVIAGNIIKDYAADEPFTITVPYSEDFDESKFMSAEDPILNHDATGGWTAVIQSNDAPTGARDAEFGFQGEGQNTGRFYVGFGPNAWDYNDTGGALLNVYKNGSIYMNCKAASHETESHDDPDTLVTKGYMEGYIDEHVDYTVDTTAQTFRKKMGGFSIISGRITIPASQTAGAGWLEATKQIDANGFDHIISYQTTVVDDDYGADQIVKCNAKLDYNGVLTVRVYNDYTLSINTSVQVYYTVFVLDHSE